MAPSLAIASFFMAFFFIGFFMESDFMASVAMESDFMESDFMAPVAGMGLSWASAAPATAVARVMTDRM